jgi:hypothetical protein
MSYELWKRPEESMQAFGKSLAKSRSSSASEAARAVTNSRALATSSEGTKAIKTLKPYLLGMKTERDYMEAYIDALLTPARRTFQSSRVAESTLGRAWDHPPPSDQLSIMDKLEYLHDSLQAADTAIKGLLMLVGAQTKLQQTAGKDLISIFEALETNQVNHSPLRSLPPVVNDELTKISAVFQLIDEENSDLSALSTLTE